MAWGWFLALLILWCVPRVSAQVLLAVNDPQVIEGNAGTSQLAFTLSLSEPSGEIISVHYYTVGSGATGGADFASTNGVAVFNLGETNATVSVAVLGDLLNEADEVVWLFLTNAINVLPLDNRGDGTILDDDPQPTLTLGNVVVVEGNSGATNAVFQVTLSAPSGQSVSAQFTTTSGNAIAGADFSPQADTVMLPAGTTNATIVIPVLGDLLDEDNEQFTLTITNALNATPPAGPATGTIMDDDTLPNLTIGDLTLLEGTGGNTPAVFVLTLDAPSGHALTVNFQTLNGTATSGADFTATNGTLIFPAGVTNRSLVAQVTADSSIEVEEDFTLRLSNPTNVVLLRTQAVVTIRDDETRTLTFTNTAPINAALSGPAEPYPTQIELSGLVGRVVKVTATLAGVSHSFPDDFDILLVGPLGQKVMLLSDCGGGHSINNLTLTFDDSAANELADDNNLASGTYRPSDYVTTDLLTSPAPGGPYGGLLTAFNNLNPNGTWSLFVYDDSGGGSGAVAGGWRLSVTMSNLVCCSGGNSDLSVTVSDSPDPATATSNLVYTARILNNGPAGATAVTFTNLLPAGVNLLSATTTHGTLITNAGVITGNLGTLGLGVQATVTLVTRPMIFGRFTNVMMVATDKVDPDLANNTAATPSTVSQLAPLLTIADATMAEGDWATSNLLFAVTLSRSNATSVTAAFTTSPGSATANTDYLSIADVITFAPGVTNVIIAVPVLGDITVEPNESFTVQITGVTNALNTDSNALGTITNDDGLPQHVQSFTWSSVSATQYVGVPIPVTITARDIANNVATTFTGPAKLTAITGSGPDVSVVLTEIDTGDNDTVEFANVAGSPVDLSGWQVTFYDYFRWPQPAVSFTVPAGVTCGANEIFTITDNGSAPGTYPSFSLGENLFWTGDEITNMVAVLLRDADGRVVDFVCAVDAYPAEISSPIFIPASQWAGAPITANTNSALTYLRTGSSDTHQAGDFTVDSPSLGALNAGLSLPFTGTRALATTPTSATSFVNGVWSGNMTILQTAGSAALRASDTPGHVGVSSAFTVQQAVDLAVGVTVSPAAVATGQNVVFTLRATNVGPVTASAVLLTNTLPASFNFVNATTSQGSFTPSGSFVTFNLGTLAPGAIATATVQATPTIGGNFTNFARIAASLPDLATTNNTAQVSVFVNTAPVLTSLNPQFAVEGSTLTVTNIATDADAPANNLTFTLLASPPTANLTANGVFTWTTTEANGPGTNLVTVKVQDNSTPNLSATQSWLAVVTELNSSPLLTAISNRVMTELTTLIITNTASDSDLPANALTFALLTGPINATLSPAGVFAWSPTEAQGPSTNLVSLKVSDNGAPSLSATQSFVITVNETNAAPALTPLNPPFVIEGNTLIVTNVATDADVPANNLIFTLLTAPPTATLTSNGIFTWTTTEANGPGTNLVTVKVTDNGAPNLSATQSWFAVVTELNSSPTLATISNRVINELTTLIITNTATDPDVPANPLTFALLNGPANATLSAAGVFNWTPLETQGPSSNFVRLKVSDIGPPSLSATQSFSILVNEANAAPMLVPLDPRFVLEGSAMIVTNFATDPDVPTNTLTFSLLDAPPGAILTTNGVFFWTPAEAQGPATHSVTVKVADNGTPSLSATQTWQVVVSEYNSPPVLMPIGDRGVNELSTLIITNTASDPDLPANNLTYALLSGPTNATLSAAGVFVWTPAESEGPSTRPVTIELSDNGDPNISVTRSFIITVNEVNSAPTLTPTPNQNATPGILLTVTNTAMDSDVPTNTLTFSLLTAPAGANVTLNGVFTWTPAAAQAGTNQVVMKVSDNGSPALSATQNFQIYVPPTVTPTPLRIAGIAKSPGVVNLQFNGPAGYTYTVESRPLAGGNWSKLGDVIAPPVNLPVLVRNAVTGAQKFYRVRNVTLPYQPPAIASPFVSNGLFHLTFTGAAGRSYAIETRNTLGAGGWSALTNVTLAASNVALNFSSPGIEPREFRVTRYSLPVPMHRIDRFAKSGANLQLDFTVAPGLPVAVETTPNPAASWAALTNLPAFTNQTSVRITDPLAAGPKFYRLNFTVPSAPVAITAQTSSAPAMNLWFDAVTNTTYTMQYRASAVTGNWQTLVTLPAYPTNSVRLVSDPAVTQPQRFYRLRTP